MIAPKDKAEATEVARQNAANSIVLARAILGDTELGRILSKYKGRPNTREIRRQMVDEVSGALRERMRATMHGGHATVRRSYSMASWECKRLPDFGAVLEYGPGAFMFDDHGDLVLHTPDGSVLTWNISRPWVDPYFHWNGDRDKPTLAPPLCITEDLPDGTIRERWQGQLVDGRLVPS